MSGGIDFHKPGKDRSQKLVRVDCLNRKVPIGSIIFNEKSQTFFRATKRGQLVRLDSVKVIEAEQCPVCGQQSYYLDTETDTLKCYECKFEQPVKDVKIPDVIYLDDAEKSL